MKFSKYIGLATLCMCLNGCTDFIDNAPDDIITIEIIRVTIRSRCWQTISLHRKAGYHIGVVTAD